MPNPSANALAHVTETRDDGLDDLMNFIAPEGDGNRTTETLDGILHEDGEDGGTDSAAADSGGSDGINANNAESAGGASSGATVEGREASGQTSTQSAAPATPATPATPDNRVADLVERLAQAQLAREERERAEREAAEARARDEENARRSQLFAPADLELTDEERQVYGQSQNVIEKLVRRELQRYHATNVLPEVTRINQLREQLGTADQNSRAAADRAVGAVIRAAVPEIDSYTATPEWQAFLNSGVPELGPGVTRGNLLRAHLQNLNADAAVALIRTFRSGSQTGGQSVASTSAPAPTPGRANGGAPASVAAAERSTTPERIPYSKYVELSEKAQRGEISMDKFDRITNFYFDKMEQGLVDMDA